MELVIQERVGLVDRGVVPIPESWASRARYVGEVGAGNWRAVVGEPTYPLRDPCRYDLHRNRMAAVRGRAFGTLVSLGPGDGRHDRELARALTAPGSAELSYIPVEISRGLLEAAIGNLEGTASIPAALLCDFEDAEDVIADVVRRHARPPVLVALLGGTVGNLDRGEPKFFAWARALLRKGDAFLLDLPLAGPGWTPADEPRLDPAAYTRAFRRFLCREGAASVVTAEAFDRRVALSLGHDPETGAESVRAADRLTGRTLLTFRRYRWEPVLRWFQSRGFAVEFGRTSITSDADKFGMGVVLLTVG